MVKIRIDDPKGVALIEFAMVAPILGLMVAAMLDFSFFYRERTVLVEAVSLATRVIAVRTGNVGVVTDNLAKARFQQSIDAMKNIVQSNGLDPALYNYTVTNTTYPDGSPAIRATIVPKPGSNRFIIIPGSLSVSVAGTVAESIVYSPIGSPGLQVIDGDSSTYCT